MAELLLENLTKQWGDFVGVDQMKLSVADREFLVLLGPSGCGKTTTMRMIAGLEEPTSGSIFFDGKRMNGLGPQKRDIAMVFQSYALYPNMTVYENIRFPLRMHRIEKRLHDEKVREAARLVELDDLLDRRPSALSGGQRQRVALARAIVRKPSVFLMDEPLSNLDAKLRVSTRAHIKNLCHELEVTTVYVTHDQIEAMTLADRVVIMQDGVIQQIGTPKEIYENPANTFVAGFIGNPAMNLLRGEIRSGTFTASRTEVSGLAMDDGSLTLGFRAEDAQISAETGQLNAPIYSIELLGDCSMVTVRIDGSLIAVKADKAFKGEIGDEVGIKIAPNHYHFFDGNSGVRIDVSHPD